MSSRYLRVTISLLAFLEMSESIRAEVVVAKIETQPGVLMLADATSSNDAFELFDFNNDRVLDTLDVDALTVRIASGLNDIDFDLDGDGVLGESDVNAWLTGAAQVNGYNEPYLFGDANLDGRVDSFDLKRVGLYWTEELSGWSYGDFVPDGHINANDLNVIGRNWLQSVTVSEPCPTSILLPSCLLFLDFLRRRFFGTFSCDLGKHRPSSVLYGHRQPD